MCEKEQEKMRNTQKMQRAVLETNLFDGGKKKKPEIKLFQDGNEIPGFMRAVVQVPVCPFTYRKQLISSASFCHP